MNPLPPSPPRSTYTRSTDSPMEPAQQSPVLTPPKSGSEPTSRKSTPPVIGTSPLPPLPPDVFLSMLKYIRQEDRYDLCRLSRAWYFFLVNEPSLWPHMLRIDLAREHIPLVHLWAVRASVNMGKSGGGIRQVKMNLSMAKPARAESTPMDCFKKTLQLLEEACVGAPIVGWDGRLFAAPSTLRALTLFIFPDHLQGFELIVALARQGRTPLFNSLATLDIQTHIAGFTIHGPFFAIWPTLHRLKIVSSPHTDISTDYGWKHLVPVVQAGQYPSAAAPFLSKIEWKGVDVRPNLGLCEMPVLTTLVLTDVNWEGRGIFLLLRLVRKTLVNLECSNLILTEVEGREHEDWEENIMVGDPDLLDDHIFEDVDSQASTEHIEDPAPIQFPRLRNLLLSGDQTPAFFSSLEFLENTNATSLPTPVFFMPNLHTAHFQNMSADLEAYGEDGEGPLVTFGRNAPNLVVFSLASSLVTDAAVFYCLAGMLGQLRELDLSGTAVTDRLMTRLPNVVPKLAMLDVRECDEVTVQGVARCVERMEDPSNEHRTLKTVRIDQPARAHYGEWDAYMWLEWIDVLLREEWDFLGQGPRQDIDDGKQFRRWKALGKLDEQKEIRRRILEREETARRNEAEQMARLESIYGFVPTVASPMQPLQQGGSGSSSSSAMQLSNSSIAIPQLVNPYSNSVPPFYTPQQQPAPRARDPQLDAILAQQLAHQSAVSNPVPAQTLIDSGSTTEEEETDPHPE